MNSQPISQQKSRLRKEILAKRDALDGEQRVEYSLAACDHGAALDTFSDDTFAPGTIVSGFFPIRSEIDPRPLMAELEKRSARLCLPVVTGKTTIEFRELVRGAELVASGFGTFGPGEDAVVVDPQILIMPLSVFDRRGGRIGYGAGHYDRAIERLVAKDIVPRLVGMAYSLQQVEHVPVEEHDRALEGVITETGYVAAQ